MKQPALAELMKTNEGITRYSLVIGIAKRAREIQIEAEENGNHLLDRPVTIATEDVFSGKVKIVEAEED